MHHFQQGQVPELAQGQPPRDSDFKVHLQGDQGKGGGEGGKGRGAGSQQLVLPGLLHCKTVTTAAPMQSDCTCFEPVSSATPSRKPARQASNFLFCAQISEDPFCSAVAHLRLAEHVFHFRNLHIHMQLLFKQSITLM